MQTSAIVLGTACEEGRRWLRRETCTRKSSICWDYWTKLTGGPRVTDPTCGGRLAGSQLAQQRDGPIRGGTISGELALTLRLVNTRLSRGCLRKNAARFPLQRATRFIF